MKPAYWITTGLTAFCIGTGGAFQLVHASDSIAGLAALGYPAYLATILGLWKVLGTIAILAPKFPRLKEWAYAGIVFDLTGAAFSNASAANSVFHVLAPLVLCAVALASWKLRPASRRI